MPEAYRQSLSPTTGRIVGGLALPIGLATGAALAVNLYNLGRFILGIDSERAFSWFNVTVFALFSPVLCIAGSRLLRGDATGTLSMLPRRWWAVIGVVFVAGAAFVAAIGFSIGFTTPLVSSAFLIGSLGYACLRRSTRL